MTVDELCRQKVATIDMPWPNFLGPEFGTKFQKESVVIFGGIKISLKHSVG